MDVSSFRDAVVGEYKQFRTAARDENRLASLSAEGRSSATTVLVASALRWMHGFAWRLEPSPAPRKRKLLRFTDNRQDAALQSGHFKSLVE